MRPLTEIGELTHYGDIKLSKATKKAYQTYASLYLDFVDDNIRHFLWRDIDMRPIRDLENSGKPITDETIRSAYYINAWKIAKSAFLSYYKKTTPKKIFKDYPTLKRNLYAVYSFYDYNAEEPIDILHINHVTSIEELFEDGNNWVGRDDAYRFNIYADLEEAIRKCGYFATSIEYADKFSDAEKKTIVRVTNELIKDKSYLSKFGNREPIVKTIVAEDLKFKIN